MKSLATKTTKESLTQRIEKSGYNFKHVALYLGLSDFAILGLAVFLFLKMGSTLGAILLASSIVFLDYFALTYLGSGEKKKRAVLEKEFVELFDYLGIYINQGIPVYVALENITKFASKGMEERLEGLIAAIDKDKSVKPYVDFAAIFPSLTIKEVMISIYLIAEEGQSEAYLRQFHTLFDAFEASKLKEEREKRLSLLSNLCFLPMIGSGATMALISVALVVIIGGLLSGI